MRRIWGATIVACGLWWQGCASAPISPTFTVWQTLQVRQTAGLYPSDWTVRGEVHAAQLARLTAWIEDQDITFAPASLAQKGLHGFVNHTSTVGWILMIDRDQPADSQLYTVLHELGHIYSPSPVWKSTLHEEAFAELTATQVCTRLGLNVSDRTAAYLHYFVPLAEQARVVQQWGPEIDQLVVRLTAAARGEGR